MNWFWSFAPKRSAVLFASFALLAFFSACSGNKKQVQTEDTSGGDAGTLINPSGGSTPTTPSGGGIDLTNPPTDPASSSLPTGSLAGCLGSDAGLGLASSGTGSSQTRGAISTSSNSSASCLSSASSQGYNPQQLYGIGVQNIQQQMQCLLIGLSKYDPYKRDLGKFDALIAVTQCMLGALNTLRQAAPLGQDPNNALLGNMQRIMSVFGNIRD